MIEGSCLCGNVRIQIEEPLEKEPEACHCTQCRKQTGNFLTAVNVRRAALKIMGSENVRWYQSSEKVQRGFCATCGSVLFWNPTIEGYQWTGVSLGCLDTQQPFKISKHTFVGNKGSYYEINDGAPQKAEY